MKALPSHVALLVPSVRKAAEHLRSFGFHIGEEEEWEGEGTLEVYVERGLGNSLLLMQPLSAGAYRRALEKRGPGFHHFAIDIFNLENYLSSLAGSGWLLHPASVRTMRQSQTAYLSRPGFPGLIEVQKKDEFKSGPLFIDKVSLPFEPALSGLLQYPGFECILRSSSDAELFLGQRVVKVRDLL